MPTFDDEFEEELRSIGTTPTRNRRPRTQEKAAAWQPRVKNTKKWLIIIAVAIVMAAGIALMMGLDAKYQANEATQAVEMTDFRGIFLDENGDGQIDALMVDVNGDGIIDGKMTGVFIPIIQIQIPVQVPENPPPPVE